MNIYIDTLGCPKNFNDTQVAKGFLTEQGFKIIDEPEKADVIMVNTCGFINDAKKESINRIFEMADYKIEDKKLVVSGCLSQRYSQDLFDEMPEVDLFIGVNEYENLPKLLKSLDKSGRTRQVNPCLEEVLHIKPRVLEDKTYSQTLKIAEGCNNRCAYCIIPSIRGKFRSKPMEEIVEEATILAKSNCKELILIAQDVTNYGIDLYGKLMLPELLKKLVKVEGIQWIRLMYCYEDKITDELIEVMAEEPKICKYIDIPIQHGSDKILKSMRRHSTNKSIKDTISKLKAKMPNIHIRTTLIVGFPDESDDDFEKLLDLVEEIKFHRLGVFAYSQEENTSAGEMKNQIDEDIKQERLEYVMRSQVNISYEHNLAKVGSTLNVLVEGIDEDGSYFGRTEFDAPEIDNAVLFTSDKELKIGSIIPVNIVDAFDYDLVGKAE